jgi:hypothetical protein
MAQPPAYPSNGPQHPWLDHDLTYRTKELRQITGWILTGASGSVIGLNGSGKSDLLGFLCYRTDVLTHYLPPGAPTVTLLPMDLNALPANTLDALFRVILRTFYEHQHRFDDESRWLITHLYLANRAATDPFLSQSALRELLLYLQQRRHRVVFALDRFDLFCTMLTREMADALRGLRDSFKDTLSYIASMRLGLTYLPEPELLGDLHRLLDQHVCHIGPMNEADTRNTIARRIGALAQLSEAEIQQIWRLSGGYPSLVLVICRWWLAQSEPPNGDGWLEPLLAETSVRQRLADIWAGLTQEEQMVLTEVHKSGLVDKAAQQAVGERYRTVLRRLATQGLCHATPSGWRIFSELFTAHVAAVGGRSRGKIWLDAGRKTLYHGEEPLLNLAPKEQALLQFLVEQPYIQHSYTDLIVAVWSGDENNYGVSNESLYQLVRSLRLKIEPNPAQPVYVVNWRSKPEGGYLFFPEGRPR